MAETLRLNDFTGGLNEVAQTGRLKENQSPSLKNIIIDELGTLKKRKGYTRFNENKISDKPIIGLYIYHEADGTRHFLMANGTDIYEADESTNTWTSIKSGLTDGEEYRFTTLGGLLYITNGVDPLMKYDGSTFTDITDAPTSSYIIDHDNHLFMADDNSLKYAEFADTSIWGTIDIPEETGEVITGLASLKGELVIFMSDSIHILYGDDPTNWQRREVVSNTGCVAPKSIVNIFGDLYFAYKDGIYKFNGSQATKMSWTVVESFKEVKNLKDMKGAEYNNQYILSYQDKDTDEYRALVNSPQHESWTKFYNLPVGVWNNFDGSQDGEIDELYFGDAEKGLVYKAFDGYSDDGEKIMVYFSTKNLNASQPELINTFRKLMVDTQTQGEFYIDYSIDNGDKTGTIKFEGGTTKEEYMWGEVTWDKLIWNEPERKRFVKSLRSAYGSSMQITIRENSTTPVEIQGITLVVRPRRERWL
jgi:hypothetical protein